MPTKPKESRSSPQASNPRDRQSFLLPDQRTLERRCILVFRKLALVHRKDYETYRNKSFAAADRAYAEHFQALKKPFPGDLVTREKFFTLLKVWIQNGWEHPARYFSKGCRKGQQKAVEAKRERSGPARSRALQLRQTGLSCRRIAETLAAEGLGNASKSTVNVWLREAGQGKAHKPPRRTYYGQSVQFGLCCTTVVNKEIIVKAEPEPAQAEEKAPIPTSELDAFAGQVIPEVQPPPVTSELDTIPEPNYSERTAHLLAIRRAKVKAELEAKADALPDLADVLAEHRATPPPTERPDNGEDNATIARPNRGRPFQSASKAPDPTRDRAVEADSSKARSEDAEQQITMFAVHDRGYGFD